MTADETTPLGPCRVGGKVVVVVGGSVVVVVLDVVDVEDVVVVVVVVDVVVVVVVVEPEAAIATHDVTTSMSDATAPRRNARLRRSTCLPPGPRRGIDQRAY